MALHTATWKDDPVEGSAPPGRSVVVVTVGVPLPGVVVVGDAVVETLVVVVVLGDAVVVGTLVLVVLDVEVVVVEVVEVEVVEVLVVVVVATRPLPVSVTVKSSPSAWLAVELIVNDETSLNTAADVGENE